MKAQKIIDAARSFVGIPYRHQGYSRSGVDCWGIVRLVCTELDILPSDFVPSASYSRLVNGRLLASVEFYCQKLEKSEPACLVLFRFPGSRTPTHMALMTESGYMVHANSDHGKVVEHGYQHPWTVMTHSMWRLPGVEQ